jgi:hypothetical protein
LLLVFFDLFFFFFFLGVELEQVSTTTKQCLEGPMNDAFIQEFAEKESVAQQQVEAVRAKVEAFEAELLISE